MGPLIKNLCQLFPNLFGVLLIFSLAGCSMGSKNPSTQGILPLQDMMVPAAQLNPAEAPGNTANAGNGANGGNGAAAGDDKKEDAQGGGFFVPLDLGAQGLDGAVTDDIAKSNYVGTEASPVCKNTPKKIIIIKIEGKLFLKDVKINSATLNGRGIQIANNVDNNYVYTVTGKGFDANNEEVNGWFNFTITLPADPSHWIFYLLAEGYQFPQPLLQGVELACGNILFCTPGVKIPLEWHWGPLNAPSPFDSIAQAYQQNAIPECPAIQ